MARRRTYKPLTVFLNTQRVGTLIRERTGAISFTYDEAWLNWEHRLPISLSLPLREDRYVGPSVMAVFDNLLPDNDAIRKHVAERVGAQGVDAFSLLSEIGRDCVGALQFLPEGGEPHSTNHLIGDPINDEEIGALLNDLGTAPLGMRQDNEFRISVAGAQEKTALLRHNGTWIKPTGTTPTTHIIKPQIGRLPNGMDLSDSVENEYLCLKLMEAFGLRSAHTEIAEFAGKKALVIERFDRLWASDGRLLRLPQEDCCQALSIPSTRKYQNQGGPGITEIMHLLSSSDDPAKDRLDFFKANILFWLIGATDGHAKNFSLALSPGGRFSMTPLYDILSVQSTFDAGQISRRDFRLAMRMGNSKHYKLDAIHGRHIAETGLNSGLPGKAINQIFDDIRSTASTALTKTFDALPAGFPAALTDSLSTAVTHRLTRLTSP